MCLLDEAVHELEQTGLTEEQAASIAIGLHVLAENLDCLTKAEPRLPDYFLKFLRSYVTSAYSHAELPVMSGFDTWFLEVLRSAREKVRQAPDEEPSEVFLAAVKAEMLAEYLGSAARVLEALDVAVEECRAALDTDVTLDVVTRDKVLDLVRQLARRRVIES